MGLTIETLPMANLLIVEDNASITTAYRSALERDHHEVRVARDADEARRLVAEQVPDLLLLDIGLPGVDGLEWLRELRANEETARLKVAILSNYSDREHAHQALRLGAVEYVEKASTTPSVLVTQVRRWLER
ncbi:MAG: response regulator [Candidatus Dormibacteria bacterium]